MANPKDMLLSGLKDMKHSKKQKKESCPEVAYDEPDYPYGLSVELNKESLEKLGIEITDFSAKDEITIVASAKIKSISVSTGEYENQTMRLQIEKMKLEK